MLERLRSHINSVVEMSDEDFHRGTTSLIPKKLRKRQYLLQAGDVCQWLAFITRGCLRQYSLDAEGRERLLRFGIEDWWMTDLESFQSHTPASTNIDALEDSELLLISNGSLDKLSAAVRTWDRYFRGILEREYKAALVRISDFVGASAEERYVHFLQMYPDLFQRIPLHQIASYLGVTPQTLSRIRQQLSKRK
jgi:CRP-like cAMP-binding protein